MWISRPAFEVLQEQLRATRTLETALTTAHATIAWMQVEINRLNLERAALARGHGVELPTLSIERGVRAVDLWPGPVMPATVTGAPLTPDDQSFARSEDLDEQTEAFRGSVGNFEDVGDDEAARAGIVHADDGTVEYAKKG
jgi:hypothetical protein